MEINECPICHGKLAYGYIKTNGEVITWSPDPKKKNGILLDGRFMKMK